MYIPFYLCIYMHKYNYVYIYALPRSLSPFYLYAHMYILKPRIPKGWNSPCISLCTHMYTIALSPSLSVSLAICPYISADLMGGVCIYIYMYISADLVKYVYVSHANM